MKTAKFISALLLLFAVQSVCASRDRVSTGLYSSVKGFGVSVDFPSGRSSYKSLTLQADMFECFVEQGNRVGAKAAFSINNIFYETGGRVPFRFHAGPGLSAGWCPDFGSSYGVVIALSGNIGCRAEFDAGIAIDFGFTLELGGHISTSDGARLGWYRSGLYGLPAPEIRIFWMFK